MIVETWLPAVGYEGWYEVSDLGRVRRIRKAAGGETCRVLVATPNSWGYPTVRPSALGVQRTLCVHLMVSAAFMGPTPDGLEINHIDGVKANAARTNLEFITPSENMKHAYRLGLNPGHGLKRRWTADRNRLRDVLTGAAGVAS